MTRRAGSTRARSSRPRPGSATRRATSARVQPATARAATSSADASRLTRRSSIRAACTRSSSATTPPTRRRWSSACAAFRRSCSPGLPAVRRELGARAHDGVRARRRLDAAHDRLAVHPRRVDPAAAARQHGPPRRRRDGDARPRLDPGLERHPDAVRHPPGLHPDAARARPRGSRRLHRRRRAATGFWGNMRALHRQPAEGLVGCRRDRRERLLLRLPAPADRQPQDLRHRHGADQGQRSRATSCSARTRPSAPPTRACSGSACRSSTGSWCATSR